MAVATAGLTAFYTFRAYFLTFWGEERIMVLPHIGGLHPQRDEAVAALLAENARRFLAGEPLREAVDRALGY